MTATVAPATVTDLDRGAYEASRAAALSGVPERTVYRWAERELVVPSVSPVEVKLWSFGDLLTLRLVDWLRRPKRPEEDGAAIARSTLAEIRTALAAQGGELWRRTPDGREVPRLLVDRAGRIYPVGPPVATAHGQGVLEDTLDLLAPFGTGPDLRRPRAHLRIVPGKVAGEPHLVRSRLTTRAVAALADRGFGMDEIAGMYPHEDPVALREAVELERDLARRVA